MHKLAQTDTHSYEPRNGHGLPHDPFNAIVGPRPIGWISSCDAEGRPNLAPYSFFNAFNYVPPIIGFSSIGAKDTLRNVQQTGEFVWNLASRDLAEAMNQTCAALPSGASEFEFAGLQALASQRVKPPRVALSPVSFECKSTQIVQLQAADGTRMLANSVVNAAGHQAPVLARAFEGLPADQVPQAYFAKGNYFTLAGRAPFSRLIYPVPEAAGLGVHLTLDLGGQAKFGPDVQWVDRADDWAVDPSRGAAFYAEIRKYWPGLPDDALVPGYAGVRPKITPPGQPASDFVIQGPKQHGVPGLVNLFGIESPGLTSALAIGKMVSAML